MHYATKTLLLTTITAAAIAAPVMAYATCWEAASQGYGIPEKVLKAVAKTESGFNVNAVNRNKNGSHDIGIMQINSAWLPTLEKYGINEESLKDACTNVKVGAWILSNNAKKLGWNWNAIGAYNVGCAKLAAAECDRRRSQYAWKIHTALNQVTDIRTQAPVRAVLSYDHSATSASNKVVRTGDEVSPVKKIMVVQLGNSPSIVQVASANIELQPRGLSVGGFLNYEEVQDDE